MTSLGRNLTKWESRPSLYLSAYAWITNLMTKVTLTDTRRRVQEQEKECWVYGGTGAAAAGARHGSWCRYWRQLGGDGSNMRRGEEAGAQQSEWVLEGRQLATGSRWR